MDWPVLYILADYGQAEKGEIKVWANMKIVTSIEDIPYGGYIKES